MRQAWRSALFVAANLAAAAALYAAVAAPAAFLAEQRERLQARSELLARYRAVAAQRAAVEALARLYGGAGPREEFLGGGGEGAVSANLQARLKAIAGAAGAPLRSVRALSPRQIGKVEFAGARIELSGSLKSVQASLHMAESTLPLLLVTACILRLSPQPGRPGEGEPMVDAQFDVYGAIRAKGGND